VVGKNVIKVKPQKRCAVTPRPHARSGRPPKKARDEAQTVPTRERIVAAAERLFEERGFQATNLSEIADEAGIRTPSLLHYFESKERLLDEVIRRAYAEIREKVVLALASGRSGPERISGVIREVRQVWEERRGVVRLAIAEALRPNGVGRNYLAQAAPLFDLVEKVLRDSVDPPIPTSAPARGALLMIFSSELLRLALGDIGDLLWGTDRDRADEVHTALLNALRANATMT
jgi:AcrR family transcriptional regulator